MTAAAFVASRASDWNALDDLVAATKLSANDRRRLAALYRIALVDLGQLRTLVAKESQRAGVPDAQPPALAALNATLARAHARIALHRRASGVDAAHFFAVRLPRTVRAALPRIGFAAAILVLSGAISYLLCRDDVELARLLAGPAMQKNAESFSRMGEGRAEEVDAVMAAFYVTNNTQVAFVSFALGITFGIGTLWTLLQNGLLLGVTLALVQHHGALVNFVGFVASHGAIELFAIFLAAGAGFGVARALIAPAPYTRVVALKRVAPDAATLVMGAACLLAIAAGFEAFVSPSAWSLKTKLTIGAINALWLTAYITLAGRGPAASGAATTVASADPSR
ncbi:MAG TPA: stage II sporulation protein M [Polyangia bacterium]